MQDPPVEPRLEFAVNRRVVFGGQTTSVRRSESGIEYYLQWKQAGWMRVASRLDTEERAVADEPEFLVMPAKPDLSSEWTSPTVPYLLRRMAEFPRELKYRSKAMMHWHIESLDESVTVPAGEFQHCLRIQGEAYLRLFVDPARGYIEQPLLSTEWYCPQIGLVRFDRDESVDSGFLSGGRISYVLTGYSD
jgi:hypothetical protein